MSATSNSGTDSGIEISEERPKESVSTPYGAAWGCETATPSEPSCGNDTPSVARSVTDRPMEYWDGELYGGSLDTDFPTEDGVTKQWKNESTNVPPPLQKPQDGVSTSRTSKGGFSHGSRAATGWLKSDVPEHKKQRFQRLHRLQHDQMGVRDKKSDTKRKQRREGLFVDVTNLGLRGANRQRAIRLCLTDDYRSSAWASHHSGFIGLAVGYAAVVAFDCEDAAVDAILDGEGVFAETARELLGTTEAVDAVGYAYRRAREREVIA